MEHLLSDHDLFQIDYSALTCNPNVTLRHILTTDLSVHGGRWDYRMVTLNPNISLLDATTHPEIDWDFNLLLTNKKFSEELLNNLHLCKYHKMDTKNLSFYANWNTIRDNKYINWDFDILSTNPYITYQTIVKNAKYPAQYNQKWNTSSMYSNASFTMKDIIHGGPQNDDLYAVNINPNINFAFIVQNFKYFNLAYLSKNWFKLHPHLTTRKIRIFR